MQMKKLLQKKMLMISIAVIILAIAGGFIGISVRSAQKQRQYNSHIEMAERYLVDLDYEQAIVEYTLALEIEPKNVELLDALEQTYLDYAQSLADAGEYEKAVSVLEDGYAQIGRESPREKMEELQNLQAQKEAQEKERLLAEEDAEKMQEEEEKKRKQEDEKKEEQKETGESEETEEPSDSEETPQEDEPGGIAAVYQEKAAEYIFGMLKEYFESRNGYPFVDERKLRTQDEFYDYFNSGGLPTSERGICVGAVEASVLEETEDEYKILVTNMLYNSSEMETGWVQYYELVIDRATEQGTIVKSYEDYVDIIDIEGIQSRGTLIRRNDTDSWNGRVFDFGNT